MPLTTLDPKTAVIVIDLQKGIVGIPAVHPVEGVIKNASLLAETFRAHGLPVVLVNVASGAPGRVEQPRISGTPAPDWAELVSELNKQPSDYTLTKRTWGAFTKTELEQYLRNLGVTQVVIAGISTSMGVESTARQAYELGFNVTLALDAMTDRNLETHINSTTRIFPRLGETGGTREIIELLNNRTGVPTSRNSRE